MNDTTQKSSLDSIMITTFAAENIKNLQKEYEAIGFGLRFGIKGGGCSGYRYVIELENEPDDVDLIFEQHGVRVFVNPEHMLKLKNSIIDWEESLMESGFKIDNPQAKRACGCGESVDF